MLRKNPRVEVIKAIKDYYRKSYELDKGDNLFGIQDEYLKILARLDNLIPVQVYLDPEFETSVFKHQQLMLVANHIDSPYFFAIQSLHFAAEINVDISKLLFKLFTFPTIRHFPIINFVHPKHSLPHVLSFGGNHWNDHLKEKISYITIPDDTNNRTEYIINKFIAIKQSHKSLLMFPEGADSIIFHHARYPINKFRSGFAVIAKKLDIPIIPFSLVYSHKQCQYRMYVHKPILSEAYDYESTTQIAEMTRQFVVEGMAKIQEKFTPRYYKRL